MQSLDALGAKLGKVHAREFWIVDCGHFVRHQKSAAVHHGAAQESEASIHLVAKYLVFHRVRVCVAATRIRFCHVLEQARQGEDWRYNVECVALAVGAAATKKAVVVFRVDVKYKLRAINLIERALAAVKLLVCNPLNANINIAAINGKLESVRPSAVELESIL